MAQVERETTSPRWRVRVGALLILRCLAIGWLARRIALVFARLGAQFAGRLLRAVARRAGAGERHSPQRCELGQLSGYPVTGTSWLPAEMVPGLCSLALVPLVVCGLWISSRWHGLDFAISALLGSSVWSGGLLMPGKALNDTGVTRPFARAVGTAFGSCLPGRVSRSWRPG
jgi:hypothetical protein